MGVLIGVADGNYNYKILDLETNKTYISHDVTFQPLVFPLRKDNDSQVNWEFVNNEGLPIEDENGGDPEEWEIALDEASDDEDDVHPAPPTNKSDSVEDINQEGVQEENDRAKDMTPAMDPQPRR